MSASDAPTVGQPMTVRRLIRVLATSTRPIECELDDGALAFVKVLGNSEGRVPSRASYRD
jgi:hypothetical protein